METIRRATAADAPAIREVLVASFRGNLAGILEEASIAAICDRVFSLAGVAESLARPGAIALVAAKGEHVAGHALASVENDAMTLHRLYVRPDGQRGGLGALLLDAAGRAAGPVKWHRLHVIRGNAGALAFYRRQGFAISGEGEDDLGPVTVPVFKMERRAGQRPDR